jgi:hypothetical protein
MELANKIAEKAPIALQLSKEAVKFASRSNLDEGPAPRGRSFCHLLFDRGQARGRLGISGKTKAGVQRPLINDSAF